MEIDNETTVGKVVGNKRFGAESDSDRLYLEVKPDQQEHQTLEVLH